MSHSETLSEIEEIFPDINAKLKFSESILLFSQPSHILNSSPEIPREPTFDKKATPHLLSSH